MADVPSNVEWIAELIPDLHERTAQFVVDTDELDDELIEVFFEEIRRLNGELQEGIAGDDADMVRAAAHSVKGMGGTLGLPEISVLGLEIENRAKDGNLTRCNVLIDALTNWLDGLE
jgi:HPt (histidine-containing phosphotransfer) domain-containing protein